jgi:hypothetical protein
LRLNVDRAYYPKTAIDNTTGRNLYKEITKHHIFLCPRRDYIYLFFAGNLTVKGDMASTLHYELQQRITAGNAMKILTLSPVGPVYGTRHKEVF